MTMDAIEAAVSAEREACAQIAEANWLFEKTLDEPNKKPVIAGLIRARGGGVSPTNAVLQALAAEERAYRAMWQAQHGAAALRRALAALAPDHEALKNAAGESLVAELEVLRQAGHGALEAYEEALAREGALWIYLERHGLEQDAREQIKELL